MDMMEELKASEVPTRGGAEGTVGGGRRGGGKGEKG